MQGCTLCPGGEDFTELGQCMRKNRTGDQFGDGFCTYQVVGDTLCIYA